jgi:tetratricopeptide (TPR) repeat protein
MGPIRSTLAVLAALSALLVAGSTGAQNAATLAACGGHRGPTDIDELLEQCGGGDRCSAQSGPLDLDHMLGACTAVIQSLAEPSVRRELAAYQRGVILGLRHDWSDAIIDFDFALSLNPRFAEAYERRGAAFAARGDQRQAIADLTQAIALKPSLARAWSERGESHFRSRDADSAIADLTRALALQPDNVADLNNRCWMRAARGRDLQGALDDCNAAVRLRPNVPAYLNSRGFVHLRLHNDRSALTDYSAALALRPTEKDQTASSLYGQGLARIGTGNRLQGERDISAALALSPAAARDYVAAGLRP